MCSVTKEELPLKSHGPFDHLLMYSVTVLSASFDRGGNEDLKILINLTKTCFKQVAGTRIEAMQSGSRVMYLPTCFHCLNCPCNGQIKPCKQKKAAKEGKEIITPFWVMKRSVLALFLLHCF